VPQTYEQPDVTTSPFETLKQSGRVPTQAQDSTVDALGMYLDSVVAAGVEPVAVVMCDGLGISGSAYGELRSLVRRSSLAVMLTHGEAARAIPKLHTHRLADNDPLQGKSLLLGPCRPRLEPGGVALAHAQQDPLTGGAVFESRIVELVENGSRRLAGSGAFDGP